MKTIRQSINALIFFSILVGLVFTVYSSVGNTYDISTDAYDPSGNNVSIGESFSNLRVIEGLDGIVSVFVPASPGNKADIVGNLIIGGLGALNTILGVLTLPYEIGNILIVYYSFNAIFINGLIAVFYSTIAFILISTKTGSDV